jgi:hypothetical protein
MWIWQRVRWESREETGKLMQVPGWTFAKRPFEKLQ